MVRRRCTRHVACLAGGLAVGQGGLGQFWRAQIVKNSLALFGSVCIDNNTFLAYTCTPRRHRLAGRRHYTQHARASIHTLPAPVRPRCSVAALFQMLIGLCGAELVGPDSVGASEGFLGWIAYLGAANAGERRRGG